MTDQTRDNDKHKERIRNEVQETWKRFERGELTRNEAKHLEAFTNLHINKD